MSIIIITIIIISMIMIIITILMIIIKQKLGLQSAAPDCEHTPMLPVT